MRYRDSTAVETAWTDSLDAWNDAGSVIFTYDYAGTTTDTILKAGKTTWTAETGNERLEMFDVFDVSRKIT